MEIELYIDRVLYGFTKKCIDEKRKEGIFAPYFLGNMTKLWEFFRDNCDSANQQRVFGKLVVLKNSGDLREIISWPLVYRPTRRFIERCGRISEPELEEVSNIVDNFYETFGCDENGKKEKRTSVESLEGLF